MQLGGNFEMIDTNDKPIYKVLVLDDNPERETTYKLMEDQNLEVEFIDLKDEDTSEIIKNIKVDPPPNIVFMDHILDKTNAASVAFMPTGMSATPHLRNKWPEVPFFSVTAVPDPCIEHGGKSFYEDVFDFSNTNLLRKYIPSVVAGYNELNKAISTETKNTPQITKFINLLNPPTDEIDSILHSIPDELRSLEKDSFSHAIYRWFRQRLHAHAGFLYSKEWAAVTLGVDLDHFDKYSDAVKDAKYSGIWSDPNEPRWWKKKLYELAIEKRVSPREPVQSAACKLFGIHKDHYSVCAKCEQPWPEILAITDEGLIPAVVPAHLECSVPHPRRFVSMLFEEPRILD